jgi:hypothetical protein
MNGDPPSDKELRDSVGESFNIFQATVAMCSIFLGFVFSALVQLLGGDQPLNVSRHWIVRVLVVALLLLLGALIGYHVTANQTVRYWQVFFPHSKARTFASILFQLGIIAMLLVIALLLFSKDEFVTGWTVTGAAIVMTPLVFKVGSFHKRAPYVRSVEKSR